jgi:peptidoglycan/LPS O-acetylase OafA/YrhL
VLQPRPWQVLLIVATICLSWLLMMAVHELGHAIHAWLSGGQVQRVVLHPLAISRTDVSPNPHPLFVAWGGAVWGATIPLVVFLIASVRRWRRRYLLAFFGGFCCLANGLYLAAGSFTGDGDAGDLMKHGAAQWQLIAVGTPLSMLGLWLWNGLGPCFGLGEVRGEVDRRIATTLAIALVAVVILLAVGNFR